MGFEEGGISTTGKSSRYINGGRDQRNSMSKTRKEKRLPFPARSLLSALMSIDDLDDPF